MKSFLVTGSGGFPEKRKNEIVDCYANISKAKKELNWRPTVSLDTGLKNVYKLSS